MKKRFIVVTILLIFLSINSIYAQDNNLTQEDSTTTQEIEIIPQDTLTSCENNEDIVGDGPGSLTDLNTLIGKTAEGREIKLDRNYTYVSGDPTSISMKRLTIDGNDYSIDGGNANYIFEIPRSVKNVLFKNINFINGKTGVYLNANTQASFINCNFTGFSSNPVRCFSSNSIATFNNCNFISNYNGINSANSITATNCNFINNTFNGVSGGGTLKKCTFSGNNIDLEGSSYNIEECKFNTEYSYSIRTYSIIANNCEFVSNIRGYHFIYINAYQYSSVVINNCRFYSYGEARPIIHSTTDAPTVMTNNFAYEQNPTGLETMKLKNANLRNNTLASSDDYITLSGESDYLNLVFLDNQTVTKNNSAKVNVSATDDMGNKVIISKVYVSINNGDLTPYELVNQEFLYIPKTKGEYVFSGKSSPDAQGNVKTGIINFLKDGYFGPFYVSQDGSDENEGSYESPFKTFETAVERANTDGNVAKVILLEGNHTGSRVILEKDFEIEGIGNAVMNFSGVSNGITTNYNLTIHGVRFINSRYSLISCKENLSIDNCSFEGNLGESLFSKFVNIAVTNSNFTNNSAKYVIYNRYENSNSIYVKNCTFDSNNRVIYAGNSKHIDVIDSVICNSRDNAVYVYPEYWSWTLFEQINPATVNLINSKFINNTNTAVYAPIVNVLNCSFKNNRGGAINCDSKDYALYFFYDGYGSYLAKDSIRGCRVYDSEFINNTEAVTGGAISSAANIYAFNTTFINNYAECGGALYCHEEMFLNECKFFNNTAIYGGAVFNHNYYFKNYEIDYYGGNAPKDRFLMYRNANITNCYFENNFATISGGAIVCMNGNISDSKFVKNRAGYGGAVYVDEMNETNPYPKNFKIEKCKFESNSALYGGGALVSVRNIPIAVLNNEFIKNDANYGGAAALENANVFSNKFHANSANIAASLFVINSTVSDSTFDANTANYGNIVYVEKVIVDGKTYSPDTSDDSGLLGASQTEEILYLFDIVDETEVFEDGYCIEKYGDKSVIPYTHEYAPEPSFVESASLHKEAGPLENNVVYYIKGLDFLQNSIDRTNVGEYVKILIAYHGDEENIGDLIWIFSDGDYLNSDNEIIRDVIDKYNSGVSGDVYVMENGTMKLFKFYNFVTISAKQNKLGYSYELIDSNVSKKAMNTTVVKGEEVFFNITVSNDNDFVMSNISISESYNKGLIFVSVESKRSWTTNDNVTWYLVGDLDAGEKVSIIFKFKTDANGTLENNVTSYMADYKLGNSSDSVKVINPDIKVEKHTLNKTVHVGNVTMFEIIVTNTGDVDLKDVYVTEYKFDSGLSYMGYQNATAKWNYELKDSKHTFLLTSILKVGESASLIVMFDTIEVGNFSNTAIAGFENKTVNATNTTEVINETEKDNVTENETPKNSTADDVPDNNITNDIPVNTTEDITQINEKTNSSTVGNSTPRMIDSKPTGNPILLLLMAFMLFGINIKRRKF